MAAAATNLQYGQDQWKIDGTADLHYLQQVLHSDLLVSPDADYSSLAGFLLERFTTLPALGDSLEVDDLRFEVLTVLERRIATVLVTACRRTPRPPALDHSQRAARAAASASAAASNSVTALAVNVA